MAIFKVLHASDFHFRAPGTFGGHDESATEAFLAHLSENSYWKGVVDLVAITGDLCETGEYVNVAEAITYFQRRLGLQLVRGVDAVPAAIVPGNHDVMMPGSERPPDNPHFAEFFPSWCLGTYWGSADQGLESWGTSEELDGQYARFLLRKERDGVHFVVVGVDFTLRSGHSNDWLPTLGRGFAYPRRLRQLDTLLARIRDDSPAAAIVLLVHFDPRPSSHDGNLLLGEAEEFMKVAHQRQIAAILCGHTHAADNTQRTDPGGIRILNAGTTACRYQSYIDAGKGWLGLNPAPPVQSFQVLTFTVGGSDAVGITAQQYRMTTGAFRSFGGNLEIV